MSDSGICLGCGAPLEPATAQCPYCGRAARLLTNEGQKHERIQALAAQAQGRGLTAAENTELGELYCELGQTAPAIRAFREAISQAPDLPAPRLLLCLALLGYNQRLAETDLRGRDFQEHFQYLKKHHPDLPHLRWMELYIEMGALSKSGNWRKAQQVGEKAISEFPDNYLLQFMYALALLRFGDTEGLLRPALEKAQHHMRLASELCPAYEPAAKNVEALRELVLKSRE